MQADNVNRPRNGGQAGAVIPVYEQVQVFEELRDLRVVESHPDGRDPSKERGSPIALMIQRARLRGAVARRLPPKLWGR